MRGYYLGIWIGGAIKSYIYGVEESRQVVEGRFVFRRIGISFYEEGILWGFYRNYICGPATGLSAM